MINRKSIAETDHTANQEKQLVDFFIDRIALHSTSKLKIRFNQNKEWNIRTRAIPTNNFFEISYVKLLESEIEKKAEIVYGFIWKPYRNIVWLNQTQKNKLE